MIRRPALYSLLFAASVAISFSAILIRLATEAPVLTIAAWRLTLATLVLLPFALRSGALSHLGRTELWLSLASGVFLALHFVLWIASVRATSVASSIVLFATNPLFVGLGSVFILKERPTRRLLAAIGLSACGGLLIGWGDLGAGKGALTGDLLALGSGILFAAYLLIGRRVRRKTPLEAYTVTSYGAAAVLLLVACLVSGQRLVGFGGMTTLFLVFMALGPQLLGHTTFNWALRYLSASTVAILVLGEPIGSTVLAYLFLGEGIGVLKGIGAAAILAGIYLSLRAEGGRNDQGA
jgi:drug/metabolite transporter (DMT)-like permease